MAKCRDCDKPATHAAGRGRGKWCAEHAAQAKQKGIMIVLLTPEPEVIEE